jgi:hypothetical protein
MDPSLLPKNRRLSHEEFAAAVESRRVRLDAEGWTERERRLSWFINQILEASLSMVPREIRRRWKGSVAVDATVVPVFARPERRSAAQKRGRPREVVTHSSDPDAAWYVRGDREGEEEGELSGRSVWGMEATLAVSGTDDPDAPFPSLVVAMAPLHKPGTAVGANGARALRSIHQRGHPSNFVAADRAYTNAKPEDFQLPARAMGYRPVLDYKIDQLGVQDSHGGMLLIEGAWYCPSIPPGLVNATVDYRNGIIDAATYRARLEERWRYRVLSKAKPDGEGHARVRCPASKPAPVARCELKPASVRLETRGRLRILAQPDVVAHPPPICIQQSLTVPPEAGAKYVQDLLFGSEEWHDAYATLRNGIEGMNGFVKDGAHEALDDPERRRVRGVAAQSVFVAFLLAAANLRKLDAFLLEEAAVEAGAVRRLPRRRRTRSITTWSAVQPLRTDTDPDPPRTA